MSLIEAEPISFDELEKQFEDIGNGNFDGGGKDDGGEGLPDEPDRRKVGKLTIAGFVVGFTGGVAAGTEAANTADRFMENRAIAAHPGQKTAIENGYMADNPLVEAPAFIAPLVSCVFIGTAIGATLQRRFKRP